MNDKWRAILLVARAALVQDAKQRTLDALAAWATAAAERLQDKADANRRGGGPGPRTR